MARKASKSLSAAVSAEIKSKFDLNKFKSSKGLDKNVKFKEQQWIPLSPAFQEIAGVPGVPMGHISLLRGHSDTGKTTALVKTAVSAQKKGILPVFIITEQKWSFEHAKLMGFECEEVVDEETGELDWDGFFIFNNNFEYIRTSNCDFKFHKTNHSFNFVKIFINSNRHFFMTTYTIQIINNIIIFFCFQKR